MNHRKTRIALMLAALVAAPAFAQTPAAKPVDRDIKQQERIEQGLQSGQLSTKEAGKLEHEETRVEKLETHADANGKVSPAEAQRIQNAQNKVSQDIHTDKTNAVKGNPESASSERLQKDVARNVNQQQRIDQGVKSGELTTREAGRLERGQAKDTHAEARAAADGHVGKHEQAHIARDENRQSDRIHDKKHNARTRG